MKKLLTFLAVLAMSAAPITEKSLMTVSWESDNPTSYPLELYEDGIFSATFATNTITTAGVTNGVYTRYVRTLAPKHGEHTFVVQLRDNNNVLSEFSNIVTQYFRMNGPKSLRISEK